MTTPTGAAPILAARKRRQRPTDLVIVSMVGRLREINPQVLADGDDWRWATGLDVCIFANATCAPASIVRLAVDIAYCGPRWLGLWDCTRREGCEVIVHIRPECLHKRIFDVSDFAAIFWPPWTAWENRNFERGTPCI